MPPKARTSSNTYEHPTPDKLFVDLSREFGPFDYDPATRAEFFTAKHVGAFSTLEGTYVSGGFPLECAHGLPGEWSGYHVGDERDGLSFPWTGRVFCNPPYGRLMWQWVKRGYDAVRKGDAELVCMLLPVRSDLRWWHKYVLSEVRRAKMAAVTKRFQVPGALSDVFRVTAQGHEPADVVRYLPGRVRYYEYVCVECGHEHLHSNCETIVSPLVECGCTSREHEVNADTNAAPFPSVVVVWRKP
jgi:hypothetical protein